MKKYYFAPDVEEFDYEIPTLLAGSGDEITPEPAPSYDEGGGGGAD